MGDCQQLGYSIYYETYKERVVDPILKASSLASEEEFGDLGINVT